MNVQVDAFNAEYRFLVQPTVTVGRLFERLAAKIHLRQKATAKDLPLFSLQVLNERHQVVVWADPNQTLAQAIKQGMAFQPMAIRFRLRACAFPPTLEVVRGDPAALELLYRQVEAKLLKAVAKDKTLVVQMDPALVTTLVALSLLVDNGPFVVAASRFDASGEDQSLLMKEVADRTATLGVFKSTEEASDKNGQPVLQLWRLFGLMTVAEAQYNYLSLLLASSADFGYAVEKVRFSAEQIYSDLKELKKAGKTVRLAVSYQGVEVIFKRMVNVKDIIDDDQVEQKSETTTASLVLDWSALGLFKQHKRSLTIKLKVEETEKKAKYNWIAFGKSKKKVQQKIVLATCSVYEAHLIYQLITAYHGEYRRRSGEVNCGRSFQGISTEVRFVLPQPEHFFGELIGQMAELEGLKLKLEQMKKKEAKKEELKSHSFSCTTSFVSVDTSYKEEENEASEKSVVKVVGTGNTSNQALLKLESSMPVMMEKLATSSPTSSSPTSPSLPLSTPLGLSMTEEEDALSLVATTTTTTSRRRHFNSKSSESGDELLSGPEDLSSEKAKLVLFPKLTFKVKQAVMPNSNSSNKVDEHNATLPKTDEQTEDGCEDGMVSTEDELKSGPVSISSSFTASSTGTTNSGA